MLTDIILWAASRKPVLGAHWGRAAEAAAFMMVWCAAARLVFHMQWISQPFIPHPYMLIALLAWAALRLGPRAVATALVALAAIAITSVLWDAGSFPLGGQSLQERLLLVQQAHNPHLKVIFTSGYSASLAGRELAVQEGQNFLPKPSTMHQILEIVRRSLDG